MCPPSCSPDDLSHLNPILLGRSPSKASPDVSYSVSSPNRDKCHSNVTLALGRGGDHHTHQFHYNPSSGMEADIWSDYRSQQTKAMKGTKEGEHPTVKCDCSPRKWAEDRHLVWLNSKSKAPYSIGTKSCPQQAKRVIANDWTKGQHGSVTIVGCMQHT